MEVKRLSLVLADISGYTAFVRAHRSSLLHAEAIITDLLDAVVVGAGHPLRLSKLEGDAVFMYAEAHGDEAETARDVARQSLAFQRLFTAKRAEIMARSSCDCEACGNIGELRLKVIIHHGEVVVKKFRQFEELAGEPVIIAHRLLKNSVPAREYLMMTGAFHVLAQLAGKPAEMRTEPCEGFDDIEVAVYYPEPGQEVLSAPVRVPPWGSAIQFLRFVQYDIAGLLGMRASRKFANLPG